MLKRMIYTILFSFLMIHNAFGLKLNNDLEEIVNDGKLTVAFVSSLTNQKIRGFDVELAARIANELSVQLDPVYAVNYNEAIALVANKKAELVISNITRTPERGKYVLFSQPYNSSYLAIIESRSNATATYITRDRLIEKYNQPGAILGAVEGTVFFDIGKEYFPKAQVIAYKDDKQMLSDVESKKINAAITDNVLGKSTLKSYPELYLAVAQTKVNDWVLEDGIAMHSDHIHLMIWINLLLATLEQDGSLKSMRSQYFSDLAVK